MTEVFIINGIALNLHHKNIPGMDRSLQIESLGSLFKEEVLQTVDHYILPNTLVLESLEPFPGYHGENLPTDAKPEVLYLVLSKKHDTEEIFRVTQHLCGYYRMQFDATPGELTLHNNLYSCIRVRGMKSYTEIADIQRCYLDAGFAFMKSHNLKDSGLIRIVKVFSMAMMADHVYKDLDDDLTFYIDIPHHFNWNLFRQATFNVKNNLDNRNFDAALGFIYQKNIIDLVRIYTKNPNVNRLQQIREKYLEEIKKIKDV